MLSWFVYPTRRKGIEKNNMLPCALQGTLKLPDAFLKGRPGCSGLSLRLWSVAWQSPLYYGCCGNGLLAVWPALLLAFGLGSVFRIDVVTGYASAGREAPLQVVQVATAPEACTYTTGAGSLAKICPNLQPRNCVLWRVLEKYAAPGWKEVSPLFFCIVRFFLCSVFQCKGIPIVGSIVGLIGNLEGVILVVFSFTFQAWGVWVMFLGHQLV